MSIFVYNISEEGHTDNPNNYYIGRGSILGNPWTHIKTKETKAKYIVNSREEAIEKYRNYFDIMYSGNMEFKSVIDDMYGLFKAGEDVYLQCFCGEGRCHGDIIKENLQKRLIKEKISEIKNKKDGGIKKMEEILPST